MAVKQKHSPDQTATQRLMMISPLLEDGLDPARISELKESIAQKHEISTRTVGRYLEAYRTGGFEGLKPKTSYHHEESTLPPEFPALLEEAIILRRECPKRSINDIIKILELEGRVGKGVLKRSTLQHHMQNRGFGSRQMRLYTSKGTASRRYQKQHRCMLFQGDIKYGPYLPIGKNGAMKQVYLSVFIDDATRFIVSARFYDSQKVEIIEDSLRRAVMQFGKPDKIYVDNGKQYRSEWLRKSCAKLGIVLLYAKPYHPEGKGKCEYFNRRIDSFLSEVALQRPQTLEELNELLDAWIAEYYHKAPHSSLGGIAPETAFRTDTRALNFVDAGTLADAFLHTQTREVDKTGCISFGGTKYEVGMKLAGRKVEVYYDPVWTEEIEIRHPDYEPFKVHKLAIDPNCGVKQELPPGTDTIDTESSRLLEALREKHAEHHAHAVATTFRRNTGGDC